MVCGGSFVVADCAKMAGAARTKSAAPVKTAFIAFISSSPCINAFYFRLASCIHHKGRLSMKHRPACKVARSRRRRCKSHAGIALQAGAHGSNYCDSASNLVADAYLQGLCIKCDSGISYVD